MTILKVLFIAVAIGGITLAVANAVHAHKEDNQSAQMGWAVAAMWATSAIFQCLS